MKAAKKWPYECERQRKNELTRHTHNVYILFGFFLAFFVEMQQQHQSFEQPNDRMSKASGIVRDASESNMSRFLCEMNWQLVRKIKPSNIQKNVNDSSENKNAVFNEIFTRCAFSEIAHERCNLPSARPHQSKWNSPKWKKSEWDRANSAICDQALTSPCSSFSHWRANIE